MRPHAIETFTPPEMGPAPRSAASLQRQARAEHTSSRPSTVSLTQISSFSKRLQTKRGAVDTDYPTYTSSCLNRISCDDAPTKISNAPGSTRHRSATGSKNAKARSSSSIESLELSPAASFAFA